MFYIFNSDNICIGSCSFGPNIEDLATRGEYCKESDLNIEIGDTLSADNEPVRPPVNTPEVDYNQQARALRDKIREEINLYVLPTSTIGDELVTDDQIGILVQDSLLLARWPSLEGWPYIDLPVLSDLTKSIIQVPVWEFLKETTGA